MKVNYEIDLNLSEDEITIKCHKLTSDILEIEKFINSKNTDSIIGEKDNKMFPIRSSSVESIYTHNKRVIVSAKGTLYESKLTLSKFENILPRSFVRISKGVIANTKHIQSIEAEFSGNYTIKYTSGNTDTLSRSYVKNLKRALGMEQ